MENTTRTTTRTTIDLWTYDQSGRANSSAGP
jgi:hypothetical protein